MKLKLRSYCLVAFVCIMGVLGLVCGAIFTSSSLALGKDRYSDLQMFTKVLNLIEQHYVEEVDTKKLIYGGIKGMLGTLDPHTNFLPPEVYKNFSDDTAGEFEGIGIEITVKDDLLTVVSPIEDTPAYKAGIKGGDKIVEIDGKSTKGINVEEAVTKMRGKHGSPVTIAIYREGFEAPKKFTLVREAVHVKSSKYTDFNDGYAYIRITSFAKHTGDELADELNKQEKNHGKIKGLIIDLRNNAGGLLDAAIEVSNQFINGGVIVSMKGRNGKNEEVFYAKKEGAHSDFPIIMLMNEYSASASEIVAGALQDHKRAIIMGTRSFGKGSVQSVVDLGDGAGLKFTVARYYTPSGRSIQAEGIEPDIHVDPVDVEAFEKAVIHRKVTREADIEGHLINETEKTTTTAPDKDDKNKVVETEVFWKKEKIKDPEKEARLREEEDAKLPPNERLLKHDYQITQAFNYLKAWTVFQSVPGMAAAPVPAPMTADSKAEEVKKPAADQPAAGPSPTPAPTKKSKATKKAAKKGATAPLALPTQLPPKATPASGN